MKYYKPKRNRFRSNNRGYGKNGSQDMGTGSIGNAFSNFQRQSFGRNGQNPEKLLEKYNILAKEAQSNGDRILSETYYQYADHFFRVIDSRNSFQNNNNNNHNNNVQPDSSSLLVKQNSDDKLISEDKEESFAKQLQNIEKT